MSIGRDPGTSGPADRNREIFTRQADAARAARLVGRKPLISRVLDRLLPRRQGREGRAD
jgi:hypothetical protein